ncbi:vesicular-fusion protein nsf-like protein, partial [Leptotrombidium deliense]
IDNIDDALLRAGRFQIKWELPLPNEKARKQIFEIHTNKYQNGLTRNYSGAEIEDLVKIAVANAYEKLFSIENSFQLDPLPDEKFIIREIDFDEAFTRVCDTRCAFGACQSIVKEITNDEERNWELVVFENKILSELTKNSLNGLLSILFEGPPKSGKTSDAVKLASLLNAPFVRVCSAENMVAFTDRERCKRIKKDFEDSYKSEYSCVIVDDIERIINYDAMRKQYSN